MKKIFKSNIFLLLIITLALILRLYQFPDNPTGFFCDEASIAYNAYKIWNTGKDEFGKNWPIFFQSFGEFKNPVFIYSSAPFVGIFGLSHTSTRIVSVVYGVMAVIAIYKLAKSIFSKKVALLSAFFLAISPWHIHMSRIGFELISSVFFSTIGFYFLYKSLKIFKHYPIALLSFALSFLSYSTPKIYLPPLILFFIFINFRHTKKWFKDKNFWFINFSFLFILLLFIYPYLKDRSFFARWNQVKSESSKLSDYLIAFINHFSLNFLFKTGDINFPGQFITRHSISGIGQLYWFQLPTLLAFAISIIKKKYRRQKIFLLAWLFVYPLGSIFTSINPQATRSIIGVVPFQIASAVGLIEIIKFLNHRYSVKKLISSTIVGVVIMLSIIRFINLLILYPKYSSDFWGWQYGAKPIMNYFLEHSKEYDQLCLEGQFNAPDIFLKFYDPNNSCLGKCQVCSTDVYDPNKKQVFAISTDSFNSYSHQDNLEIKHKILYPNNSIAFFIVEIKNAEKRQFN